MKPIDKNAVERSCVNLRHGGNRDLATPQSAVDSTILGEWSVTLKLSRKNGVRGDESASNPRRDLASPNFWTACCVAFRPVGRYSSSLVIFECAVARARSTRSYVRYAV